MKVTIARVMVCALLVTMAGTLATGALADDAKFDDKQYRAGVKEMAKAYKELHTAHVAHITGYYKNASQAFNKSLKHFTDAEEHLMKSQVTKSEAKQLDQIKKHLADANKQFDAFVKAYDTDHSKNAEQKLNKAVESYQKAMDLL